MWRGVGGLWAAVAEVEGGLWRVVRAVDGLTPSRTPADPTEPQAQPDALSDPLFNSLQLLNDLLQLGPTPKTIFPYLDPLQSPAEGCRC